ncbi:MAG TPA: F0F1 ATP synthase subunit epsilon [Aliidongia sp.]|nr:F0F1 ATP synthase subunit epsilon [Aliidongia sp.]
MRLTITTPLAVILDEDGVTSIQAEDGSGCFGVQPGHADFLTSLAIAVLRWRSADGGRRYCAVRRGMLSVTAGRTVSVATREAVLGDDIAQLHETVLGRFRADLEAERVEHVESTRLQLAAIRQIMRHLRPDGGAKPGAFA